MKARRQTQSKSANKAEEVGRKAGSKATKQQQVVALEVSKQCLFACEAAPKAPLADIHSATAAASQHNQPLMNLTHWLLVVCEKIKKKKIGKKGEKVKKSEDEINNGAENNG